MQKAGGAGSILIKAEDLRIDGNALVSSSTAGPGNGGGITAEVGSLSLSGGIIKAATTGPGSAGDLIVSARHSIDIVGRGIPQSSDISVSSIPSPQFLTPGPAGRIEMTADRVSLTNGGAITASTWGRDDLARKSGVTIAAGSLMMNGGWITSATSGPANAGSIDIKADTVALDNQAFIMAESFGPGKGGDIAISARRSLGIANPDPIVPIVDAGGTRFFGSTSGVFTASVSHAPAGDIFISAGDLLGLRRGVISSYSKSGEGGRIDLKSEGVIDSLDSVMLSSVAGRDPGSNAGDVKVHSPFLVLDRSRLEGTASQGNGGDVLIDVGGFLMSDSTIEVTSEFGSSGNVVITAPDQDLSRGLAPLAASFLDVSRFLRERCAARRDIGSSRFVDVGRGGIAPRLDELLPGSYAGIEGLEAGRDQRDRKGRVGTLAFSTAAVPCVGEE